MPNNDLYRQLGKNEGDIQALFDDVKEIKKEMKELLAVVNKLVSWKVKVSGLAMGVAAFSTIFTNKTLSIISKFFS